MQYLRVLACALALAPSVVFSAPSASNSQVNPYIGKEAYANKEYARKLEETIQYFNQRYDYYNAAKTKTVQKIPTFAWISASSDISKIKGLVDETLAAQAATNKQQILQLVIYNLPDRDCSAKASDGEFQLDQDGLNKYKNYIDTIARELDTPEAKKLKFVVILEPDSLGNAVTNLNVPKCAKAAPAYKEGISYAIAKLQHPNLSIYVDAANGGWLGWDDNLSPTAVILAEVLQGAQAITPGATVRGVAINVSNYNQYVSLVRENFTELSNSWDESHYVASLTPHLQREGFPAHFIVDQSRAGKGGIRTEWGQWCNVRNAGFGIRPTTDQGILKNSNVDAIVWIKPGGESDGTSDRNAARFDETCASPVAHVPAPEAGSWFNEYVINLVKEADPELEATWSWP
ncbi:1,4-beta-D-glucan cellobiohydrolase CEL6B [Psilocybe cubensis]|uniref:1,4-beta-D-glucan cellobiohydrolase CEL6B n=2 Tax=Psilocybe cubensis TaxID=181762 RepID=A0ACB8HH17_PSICU|nr:1,4-beta-D-glucan cellobiohydrolase CEL6B [Psilocybe cubensis]KAH9487323.1 1,4-beta-D-glucan cellobiohydrolase CEL6B [Psilocybe cubensis]